MSIHPATDDLIAFLNSLLEIDRAAVSSLISFKVPCNGALADHPSVQVSSYISQATKVGMLGVLNGFCGTIDSGPKTGWGPITAIIEHGEVARFERTAVETPAEGPAGG